MVSSLAAGVINSLGVGAAFAAYGLLSLPLFWVAAQLRYNYDAAHQRQALQDEGRDPPAAPSEGQGGGGDDESHSDGKAALRVSGSLPPPGSTAAGAKAPRGPQNAAAGRGDAAADPVSILRLLWSTEVRLPGSTPAAVCGLWAAPTTGLRVGGQGIQSGCASGRGSPSLPMAQPPPRCCAAAAAAALPVLLSEPVRATTPQPGTAPLPPLCRRACSFSDAS